MLEINKKMAVKVIHATTSPFSDFSSSAWPFCSFVMSTKDLLSPRPQIGLNITQICLVKECSEDDVSRCDSQVNFPLNRELFLPPQSLITVLMFVQHVIMVPVCSGLQYFQFILHLSSGFILPSDIFQHYVTEIWGTFLALHSAGACHLNHVDRRNSWE